MPHNMLKSWLLLLPVVAVLAGGCSQKPELPGGTRGIVLFKQTPVADVQVNIYQDGIEGPLAFGVSEYDGHFVLRLPGTLEAVWLQPGQYRMTIESVGEHFLHWSPQYSDPVKTPLQQDWNGEADDFRVEVPIEPKYAR